jgi:phage terminase large subunit
MRLMMNLLERFSPQAQAQLIGQAIKRAQRLASYRSATVQKGEFRGGNLAVQTCADAEIVLIGPAGTGKTYANLVMLNRELWRHPNLRVLIVRQVRADLAQSVLVTFERDVLGYGHPICQGATREHRQAYYYPNGSMIALAGMDRPGKVLSSEWDIIYVPEATQLSENSWEMLGMRLARASNYPHPRLIGDTNPDSPHHWLKRRIDAGLTTGLYTRHEDNPLFHDGTRWTEQGELYLSRLNRLTGVRRARYLEGKWAQADGMVYDGWDDAVHVIDPFEIPADWLRYRAIDFGYSNPFTCQWWAQDPDGRLYLYRELYRTQRLVEDHAADIQRLSAQERIVFTVADHDAEDRATLHRHGIITRPANKAVLAGIQAVQERLRVQDDGKPRLFVFRNALAEFDPLLNEEGNKRPTCLLQEISGYVWANKATREEPVKQDDHGLDAMRYMVMALTNGRRKLAWAIG